MDKTAFGDRMKMYERQETGRRFVPLLPVYARIDGKCFSRFTRGMARPYDEQMSEIMTETTKYLVDETNALIGYTQSDEINLAWYSDRVGSQIFFDGKIQKMVSICAALASVKFFDLALCRWGYKAQKSMPVFDCRVFQLPTKEETANMFLWRERDATKNAIQMAAQSCHSHKELMGKNGSEQQEMLFQAGINFNDYPAFFKRGIFIRRELDDIVLSEDALNEIPEKHRPENATVQRHRMAIIDMPSFGTVTNRVGVLFDKETPETDLS